MEITIGMAKKSEQQGQLPSTLQRSPAKAKRTFKKTLESAEETYRGDESRAHRAAYASLKHSFEKVGDHWEPKATRGPSDAQAEQSGRDALERPKPTAEGVDANASKRHLREVATRLNVAGRSRMTKPELVDAIVRANRTESARSRNS